MPLNAATGTRAGTLDEVTTQEDFGRALTELLTAAGLSVRKLSRQAGIPNSTLHDWFTGEHLPSDDEQVSALRRVLALLGASPAELECWLSALARARRPAGRKPAGDAPYRGLASFSQDDAGLFFGREEVASRLAELMSDGADSHDLPLVLVGPSGAGKSSVLRAGLLPRLTGPAVVFEPMPEPLAALQAALAELAASAGPAAAAGGQRGAVIIDQFESTFTRVPDEARRREFIAAVCDLAASRSARVAIALRADFYDHAIRYPELAACLQLRQVVLGPMTVEQVSRAITEPAKRARLAVEEGLVRLLLDDLAPHGGVRAADAGAYEPGALPLLSHAMLATWDNSRGGTLSIAGYLASGRISQAVARTAEAAYTALSPAERDLARRLFLRLVHVADDAPPTRAPLPLSELLGWHAEADTRRVLDVFVGERLVTVDAEVAQITHDALLAAWPRLRSWLADGQAGLVTRRRVTEAARAWDGAGREDTWLWRGAQLDSAAELAADPGALPRLASDFLDASLRTQRARQRADRRRTRGLQALVAVLTVLVVLIGFVAAYAFQQRHDALATSDNATSRQLATEAQQLRAHDPAVAAQLSVASYGIARTPQATAALLESAGAPSGARIVDTSGQVVQWVAISPDRALMAAAGADGTLKLWNVASPGHPVLAASLVTANASLPLYTTAFSPDGRVLAAAGAGARVMLWNVADPAHPVPLSSLAGPASTIYSVAFSPDGTTLAAGSNDAKAWLWNVSDPARPAPLGALAGATGAVNSVAFGAGGTILAEGGADHRVRLWNLAGGRPALAATLSGPAEAVSGVALSATGVLAATGHDGKVWLWKVSDSTATGVRAAFDGTLTGAANWTNASAFSPGGRRLAVGTAEASVLVWNVATRRLTARIPAPQPVTSIAWDGARRVAASDADGTATIWRLPTPALLAVGKAASVAYRPDGKVIAVGGAGVQLWDAATRDLIAARSTAAVVNGLSFSPDDRYLAAALGDGTVQVMSASTLAPVGQAFPVTASGYAESVAFSPDGRILATGADDGSLRLFSMASPARPRLLAQVHDSGPPVYTVAFAPDGTTVAVASTDDYARLWNVSDPAAPVLDARLGGMSSYAIALAFSPDSRLLAVGSADKTVHLWNVADPARAVQAGAPLTGPSGYVWAAAVSPDGRLLAVGSTNGSVWLWNIADPARPSLIAPLAGPANHVYSVAFSPSGRRLAATSYDGTVFTWDTAPAAARSAVCSGLGQPLTPAEWSVLAPGIPYRAPCS